MERLVVWGGIGLLLLVAVAEVVQQRGYYATVKKLEDIEKTPFSEKNPRTATIKSTAEGWYSQTQVPGSKLKTVRLKWPSLFKQYLLDVDLDSKDRVLSFVTVGDESLVEPMKKGPSSKPAAAPSAKTDEKASESTPPQSSEPAKADEPATQPEKTESAEPKTDK